MVVLWGSAMPIFTKQILTGLEQDYPFVAIDAVPAADAIVILGGGVSRAGEQQDLPYLGLAINRLFYGMKLYQAHKSPLIILSGSAEEDDIPEAEMMAELLKEFGITGEVVIKETQSRNTHENAVNILSIIRQQHMHSVLLVTSVWHMRRALATFRTLGIQAFPVPVDQIGSVSPNFFINWLPDARALFMTSIACKEYIGWIYYRLRGWIIIS